MKTTRFFLVLSVLMALLAPVRAVESMSHPPGRLGVALHEVHEEDVHAMKLPGEYGARITAFGEESPAEQAGLREDDVVISYNGQRVESALVLARMVSETPAGRVAELRVMRDGRALLALVTLGEVKEPEPPEPPAAREPAPAVTPLRLEPPPSTAEAPSPKPAPERDRTPRPRRLGARIVPVDAQLGEVLNLPKGVGLVVTEVLPGSAAEAAGLQPEDVLFAIRSQPVTSAEQAAALIQTAESDEIAVHVHRHGERRRLVLRY